MFLALQIKIVFQDTNGGGLEPPVKGHAAPWAVSSMELLVMSNIGCCRRIGQAAARLRQAEFDGPATVNGKAGR